MLQTNNVKDLRIEDVLKKNKILEVLKKHAHPVLQSIPKSGPKRTLLTHLYLFNNENKYPSVRELNRVTGMDSGLIWRTIKEITINLNKLEINLVEVYEKTCPNCRDEYLTFPCRCKNTSCGASFYDLKRNGIKRGPSKVLGLTDTGKFIIRTILDYEAMIDDWLLNRCLPFFEAL